MLKIGDFSKLSRISIRMLRHYDQMGLLMPETIDPFTKYRYYSEGQLPLASRIHALKDMGFGLKTIVEILETYGDPEAFRSFLRVRHSEMQAQLEKTNRQLLMLETTLNRIGKEDQSMNYTVVLKEMPQRRVASLRKVIPAYDQESLLWNQMMEELKPQQVKMANPCYGLAVFHDEGYKESDVDVEIQISLDGEYEDTENVVFKTVPKMTIASATYQGSYEQLTDVNMAVANWVRDNHYTFHGASFCIYHVSPAQTEDPSEYVTEVCFPVEKK